MTATYMSAYEHLFSLEQSIKAHEDATADLRDNILHVALVAGGRVEKVTCAPRRGDPGTLWLWNSRREAIAPAGHPDAVLQILQPLRDQR